MLWLLQSLKQQYISCGLPAAALESFQGRLISVTHSVELLLDTGTFVSDPTVSADIFVYKQEGGGVGGGGQGYGGQGYGYAPPLPGIGQQQEQQQAFVAPSAPPVPPGWNPVTAPCTYQDPPAPTGASTTAGGGGGAGLTIDGLLATLEQSFDAIADTERWVQAGGGAAFTPSDLARAMQAVNLKLAQPLVMHALMQAPGARAITCEHVVAAARASEESQRGDVVRQMGPHCVDGQDAPRTVKPYLSPFQWTLVAPSFLR